MEKKKDSQWEGIYKKGNKDYKYYDILSPHEDMGRIAKYFRSRKARKILDLGCGAGRNLLFLSKQGFEVFGLDYSKNGIGLIKEELKKHKLKADLKVTSFYKKLPYKDNSFDALISIQSLQHGTENKINFAIKEIQRVLRPDGLIFITLSGRISKGEVRYCLVKTAKKIAQNTYVPTNGSEKGLTHFIYTKKLIFKHFSVFRILKFWKDEKDYYCFLAQKKEV